MDSKSRGQNRDRGQQRGGRARGTGRNRGGGSRDKKRDMGRGEWSRTYVDKRARNDAEQESKRRKVEASDGDVVAEAGPSKTDQGESEKEERKPKRKVAVLLGYSGSGYKGMQLNGTEKTIEADIFAALVAAGAISKANADDPKKSSLVRCARTDKGVHAAGNVISLKLIVEDPDIVQKINHELSPQIRVWGIERTNASFSCYQACDSRVYEYLIPTHVFLPPHPHSYLGKKVVELAEAANDRDGLKHRQEEISHFWAEVEASYIEPILAGLDPATRDLVNKALYDGIEDAELTENFASKKVANAKTATEISEKIVDISSNELQQTAKQEVEQNLGDLKSLGGIGTELAGSPQHNRTEIPNAEKVAGQFDEDAESDQSIKIAKQVLSDDAEKNRRHVAQIAEVERNTEQHVQDVKLQTPNSQSVAERSPLEIAIKSLKAAYIRAKKRYRIGPARLAQVQSALDQYIGTRNFHNYTVNKAFRDPSAKRVIKSFKVSPTPIIINDTEWLSLKVHGQSFMMHQIRKMVSMAALVVRCGCPLNRIIETYGEDYVSIPKAPGLGLLLERPVFDSYNERAVSKLGREKIDFGQFEKEMEAFKQREIYERIFREEEQDNQFHAFFSHVDNFKAEDFLYLTSAGMSVAKKRTAKGGKVTASLDSESEDEGTKDLQVEEG
ncbi:MAG: hypothetical protein M1812_001256 [Candelaria pacifica]|nr:MAG: hypothetical protein M1812_001256 [Candelaria pacifica]